MKRLFVDPQKLAVRSSEQLRFHSIMNDRKDRSGNSDTLLGFDFGTRKIGVAIGDLESGIASPLKTLAAVRQMPDWRNISELINTWQPSGLVVGVSRQADESDNPVTSRMLRFCRQLDGRYGLPVYQVDEFLTTFEAKQLLFDDTGVDASTLWKVQDRVAAQLILQTWLNENRKRTGEHA